MPLRSLTAIFRERELQQRVQRTCRSHLQERPRVDTQDPEARRLAHALSRLPARARLWFLADQRGSLGRGVDGSGKTIGPDGIRTVCGMAKPWLPLAACCRCRRSSVALGLAWEDQAATEEPPMSDVRMRLRNLWLDGVIVVASALDGIDAISAPPAPNRACVMAARCGPGEPRDLRENSSRCIQRCARGWLASRLGAQPVHQ